MLGRQCVERRRTGWGVRRRRVGEWVRVAGEGDGEGGGGASGLLLCDTLGGVVLHRLDHLLLQLPELVDLGEVTEDDQSCSSQISDLVTAGN